MVRLGVFRGSVSPHHAVWHRNTTLRQGEKLPDLAQRFEQEREALASFSLLEGLSICSAKNRRSGDVGVSRPLVTHLPGLTPTATTPERSRSQSGVGIGDGAQTGRVSRGL